MKALPYLISGRAFHLGPSLTLVAGRTHRLAILAGLYLLYLATERTFLLRCLVDLPLVAGRTGRLAIFSGSYQLYPATERAGFLKDFPPFSLITGPTFAFGNDFLFFATDIASFDHPLSPPF